MLCLCGIFLSYVVFPIQANRAKKEKKKCHLFVRRTQIAVTFLIQNSFVWMCDPGGGGKKKQQRIHVLVESSLQLTACLHSGLSHTGKRQESPLVSLALLAHAWERASILCLHLKCGRCVSCFCFAKSLSQIPMRASLLVIRVFIPCLCFCS